MKDEIRWLGIARVAIGAIFLIRTTPLFYLVPSLNAHHGGPLFGWPEPGYRFGLWGVVFPASMIAALCVVRTIAAALFMLGLRARVAGVVASVSGYLVYSQEPFVFIFTIHVLYTATFLLAISDAPSIVALRPSRACSPSSGLLLLRAYVVSIYAWSALAKLRPAWLSGYALVTLHESGLGRGAVGDALLATEASCRTIAWGTLVIEALLPPLLVWSRSRTWALGLAFALHAAIELAVHPDVFGWVMAALLLAFWPAGDRSPARSHVITR